MQNTEERMLLRNAIETFVLRFDMPMNSKFDYQIIINDISKFFDRIEKRLQSNYQVKFTTDNSEVKKVENYNYILTNEHERFMMTFSVVENAFWFHTNNYVDNNTYLPIINELIKALQEKQVDIVTRRIGMRFINKFNCEKPKNISKIFEPEISKFIVQRLIKSNINRIIGQEEYNFDSYKVRVQYGIPNKFYPAIINNYDLLLDIDAYDDKLQEVNNWAEVIKNINHSAYKAFNQKINPDFLNMLK